MKAKVILICACLCIVVIAVVASLMGRGDGEGSISIDCPGGTLRLSGGFLNNITLGPGPETRRVAAKDYVPKWLTVAVQNGRDTWRLQSSGPWGDIARVKVKKNETTVVKAGPPLQIMAGARVNGRDVSVGLAIFGQAGEKYSNVITMNGSAMPSPRAKLIDQDGNVLASGRFEYG